MRAERTFDAVSDEPASPGWLAVDEGVIVALARGAIPRSLGMAVEIDVGAATSAAILCRSKR